MPVVFIYDLKHFLHIKVLYAKVNKNREWVGTILE